MCVVAMGRCVRGNTACVDASGSIAIPVADGNECTLATSSETRAVCRGGECVPSGCGDGVIDADNGEQCDAGEANSDGPGALCRRTCQLAGCGDGIVDGPAETCDDGNDSDADACLMTCQRNVCGDGYLDAASEACDDGNGFDNDDCTARCLVNVCGDGLVASLTGSEACDDENTNPNDDCDACARTAWSVDLSDVLWGRGLGGAWVMADDGRIGQALAYGPGTRAFAFDNFGNLYSMNTDLVRVVRDTGEVQILYDGPSSPLCGANETGVACGDGGPLEGARFFTPLNVVVDAQGNLFLADEGSANLADPTPGRVCRVEATTHIVSTVAGGGADTGPCVCPRDAQLGLVDSPVVAGSLLLFAEHDASTSEGRVRLVDLARGCDTGQPCSLENGYLVTVAGGGAEADAEDVLATDALVVYPHFVVRDATGNVYFDEYDAGRVRKVQLGDPLAADYGHLTTFFAPSDRVMGMALDRSDHLVIAERDRLVRFDLLAAPPVAQVIAANPPLPPGDAGSAIGTTLGTPRVALDSEGRLLVGNRAALRIQRLGVDLARPWETRPVTVVGDASIYDATLGPIAGPPSPISPTPPPGSSPRSLAPAMAATRAAMMGGWRRCTSIPSSTCSTTAAAIST